MLLFRLLSVSSVLNLPLPFSKDIRRWTWSHPGNPGWLPHLKTLNDTCKDPFSKSGHICRFQGLGCGHVLGGHHSAHYSCDWREPWIRKVLRSPSVWSLVLQRLHALCQQVGHQRKKRETSSPEVMERHNCHSQKKHFYHLEREGVKIRIPAKAL